MKILVKPLFFAFLSFLGWTSPVMGEQLLQIRVGSHDGFTRIVFDFEGKPKLTLAPFMHTHQLRIPLQRKMSALKLSAGSLVKSCRTTEDRQSIDIEFLKPVKSKKIFLIPPTQNITSHRYVLDIEEDHTPSLPPIRTQPPPVIEPANTPKRTVIIDAGHGGIDAGAIGHNGTKEKTVTLSIAQRLFKRLNAKGKYKCILTRDKDKFLKLGYRLKKANAAKGDIFISLHADSNPRADTRGLAVYTLSSVASDREAERLAQKENAADLVAGAPIEQDDPEVAHILVDLVKRETMNLSTQLARVLTKKMGRHVFLLRKPHRFADFYVLRSPSLPSVLIELGCLSNKDDESLLNSLDHQEKICEALEETFDQYFDKHYA